MKPDKRLSCRSTFLVVFALALGSVQGATLSWIAGTDGAWEEPTNWQTDDAVPVNRVPVNGDTIRPVAAGVTITYSAATGTQELPSTTIWQDASATTSFLQTGGDLEVNQLYLATLKTDTNSLYKITGGRLFINRNLNMTWSNSNAIDSRFLQAGGSVRIGDGNGEGLMMCIKSSNQIAFYDLEAGDFEASLVTLGVGGANSSAYFTQHAGTTAVINRQLSLGRTAGTTGEAIVRLNGGELIIEADTDPIVFTQPGAPVYVDIAGGALNLKGTWDYAALSAILDADFRAFGAPADSGDLAFEAVTIDASPYTRITAQTDIPMVITKLVYDPVGEEVTLTWDSQPGTSYEVLWSTNLPTFNSGGVVSGHPSESTTQFGPAPVPLPAARMYFRLAEAMIAP